MEVRRTEKIRHMTTMSISLDMDNITRRYRLCDGLHYRKIIKLQHKLRESSATHYKKWFEHWRNRLTADIGPYWKSQLRFALLLNLMKSRSRLDAREDENVVKLQVYVSLGHVSCQHQASSWRRSPVVVDVLAIHWWKESSVKFNKMGMFQPPHLYVERSKCQ